MMLKRSYRFRLKPTESQKVRLLFLAGARRFVYNWALERRKSFYVETGKTIPKKRLSRELTELKQRSGTAWLRQADAQALQQALRDLDRAFEAFFSGRARFPRFRSKKRHAPTFRVPQRVRVSEGRIYCPKVGWVRFRKSRGIEGRITSATFKRDATGKWHVSVVSSFDLPNGPLVLDGVDHQQVVGLDAGLIDFAVLSDGRRFPAPRYSRRANRRLRRAHRALSRKKRGSEDDVRLAKCWPASTRR